MNLRPVIKYGSNEKIEEDTEIIFYKTVAVSAVSQSL
jgi:hypothetical protein